MQLKRLIWYTIPLRSVGGGERLLFEGLKWFKENGVEPFLFADGEPVEKEALFDSQYTPSVIIFPQKTSGNKISSLLWMYRKVKFLKKYKPDILIANSQWEAWKIYFHNLFAIGATPYVCFIHGSFFQFSDETDKYALIFRSSFARIRESDPVYKELIPARAPKIHFVKRIRMEIMNYLRYLAVRKAKAVFVMTNKQKKEIELLYKHPNVIVNHGAFSKEIFNYRTKEDMKVRRNVADKTVIFSMCRLVAKKRVDLIVSSFALFQKENANTVLFVGGNGPEKENLQSIVKELGIEQSVQFLGYVPDHELIDYYCSTDVFVTADNADYDITTFVALALGKKVVASNQHEFEPHLERLNLLFHADPTPQGFSKAYMEAICSDRPPSTQAEQLLDDYSWEYYFGKIKTEIEKIRNL
jgi:glycosyltransferase involved in cell wall biosynthesis